jgi:hypothetical protein
VITVTGPLLLWTGENGSWHFLAVPEQHSVEIRAHSLMTFGGMRSVKVEASIGGVSWRTSIFPMKNGGYLLPVRAQVRREATIAAGDEVTVSLELV